MRRWTWWAATVLALSLVAAPARATPPVERLRVDLGAGVSVPISDAGDRFREGAAFKIGAQWKFTDRFSAGAEFFHSFYGVKAEALTARHLDGDHQVRYGELVAAFRFMQEAPWDLYVIGGPGLYYRRVEILKAEGTTAIPVCDPWLAFCFGGQQPVTSILGRRSTMDWGASGGLGIDLRAVEQLQVFVEARYHFIYGPRFNAGGVSKRAVGSYIPVLLGIRF